MERPSLLNQQVQIKNHEISPLDGLKAKPCSIYKSTAPATPNTTPSELLLVSLGRRYHVSIDGGADKWKWETGGAGCVDLGAKPTARRPGQIRPDGACSCWLDAALSAASAAACAAAPMSRLPVLGSVSVGLDNRTRNGERIVFFCLSKWCAYTHRFAILVSYCSCSQLTTCCGCG